MNNHTVFAAVIIGVSLVVSSYFVSSAIEAYGASLVHAAQYQPSNPGFPSVVTMRLEGGHSPLRVQFSDAR